LKRLFVAGRMEQQKDASNCGTTAPTANLAGADEVQPAPTQPYVQLVWEAGSSGSLEDAADLPTPTTVTNAVYWVVLEGAQSEDKVRARQKLVVQALVLKAGLQPPDLKSEAL
jgi:hypothetical protein